MQAFLQEKVSPTPDIQLRNLAVSGASTFEVKTGDPLPSSMTFDHLKISYDVLAHDRTLHTDIDITGSVTGNIDSASTGQGTGEFTLKDISSTGEADTTTSTEDLGPPMHLNFQLCEEYGAQTRVQYTCSDQQLFMAGYVGGKYVWGYSYSKV